MTVDLIRWANDQPAPILSLDTPSGLDVTTGRVADPCVEATVAVTLALPKTGLRAAGQVGLLYLADISVPRAAYRKLNITAAWPAPDPGGDGHRTWVRERWAELEPHSVGVYANFLSDEDADGVAAAYGSRLTRLTALKDRYDPANFFRLNANITPSGTL